MVVIAAYVAGRIQFGTFWPAILIVAAIAAIIAFFTLRSQRSVAYKALVVTAIVAVVVVAIPASSKVVYPVYSHFFGEETGQGAQAGPAGTHHKGARHGGGAPTSGLLVMSNDSSGLNFGYIDPDSGKYAVVSTFKAGGAGSGVTNALEQVSPDLTKLATVQTDDSTAGSSMSSPPRAGWIDTSGKFTAVSPAAPPASDFQQSLPPTYSSPVFDGAGNFYYRATQGNGIENVHLYKLPAGSTSDPQEVTPTPKNAGTPLRNPDGTLNFDCPDLPGQWLGSDSRMTVATTIGLPGSSTSSSSGFAIVKYPVATSGSGCPTVNQNNQDATKVFDLGIQNVSQPVANPDGTKIAFINTNSPGGLYVVDVGGDNKSNRIAAQSDLDLNQMTLIGWN
ncbi:hypothetical protein [Mycobacterium kyorinense]|uniref:hypothetical protein n=1 Tax=Mycobacterium kyorinense TaxID=487514 RepID=UPI001E3C8CA4|nr:hypothetical protein [Mycobacterium kyorinense]